MKEKLFTRNFVLLIFGQISSLLGNYTLRFALSMYILEQTGSASVFAGLLALAMLPTILLSPFGGILADRANRKNIMVTLDTLSGITVLMAGFAMDWNQDIVVIGILLVILSVLGAFESPTVQACVPQMLSGDCIVKGNAVVSQVTALASLITPFLGSIFYTAWGIRPVFYAAVVCFFVTALLECFIQLEYKKPLQKMGIREMIKEDISISIHFLFRKQTGILKLLLLAAVVSLFVAGVLTVGFPYLVRTVLGLSAEYYGVAESVVGIASIFGSLCVALLAKKLRLYHLGILLMLVGSSLVPCGIIFLLEISGIIRYLVLILMFFLCMFGCSFFSTYAISVIQERTPEHLMGKIMSFVFTLSLCAQPLGNLVYGVLFDQFSDQVYLVLIPSGLMVWIMGIASRGFFTHFENKERKPKIY